MKIIALTVFGLFTSLLFIIKRGTNPQKSDIIRKALASIGFLFIGIATIKIQALKNISYTDIGLSFVFAMFFGVCGDILLDCKYVFSEYKSAFLNAGFLTFLIGHIFYTIGICQEAKFNSCIFYIIIAIVFIVAAIAIFLLEKPLKLDFNKHRIITILYTGVLAVPSCASVLATIFSFSAGHLVRAIGFILFALSDIVLSQIYFGEKPTQRKDIILNHTLYYIAQYMIAFSHIF